MATGHFYLNQDSVGAPQFSAGAGKMIAILDWALDIAGAVYWEKVYSGTNVAVYRSKTGIRPYLRVDDTPNETAVIRMYETMSDINTGTGACPDGVLQVVGSCRISKCDASDGAVDHDYHIVGDSEFFFFAGNAETAYFLDGQPTHFRPWFFGEIASMLAVDSYPCVLGGGVDTVDAADYNDFASHMFGTSYGRMTGITSDNSACGDPGYNLGLLWLRNADGTINSSGGYPWANTPFPGAYFRMDAENPASFAPFFIQCSNGSTSTSSMGFWSPGNANAVTRGRVPYIYRANWIPGALYGGPVSGDIITVGAAQYVCMVAYGAASTNTWGGTSVNLLRITDDEPDR